MRATLSFGEFVSLCSACFRCRKTLNRLKGVLRQFGRDESKANALETLDDVDHRITILSEAVNASASASAAGSASWTTRPCTSAWSGHRRCSRRLQRQPVALRE